MSQMNFTIEVGSLTFNKLTFLLQVCKVTEYFIAI